MLSYKLKHLCSQVFASLAAFGLFSLGGGEARAAVKNPSASVSFNGTAANFTVTASYSNKCTFGMYSGIADGVYSSSGTTTGCVYTCKPGYYYRDGSSDVTTITGVADVTGASGEVLTYKPARDCFPKPTCATGVWSDAGVVISKTLNSPTVGYDGGIGYFCSATCKNGFTVNGAANGATTSKTAYATTSGVMTVAACKGKPFSMIVDCGAGASYNGGSQTSGTVSVTYGKSFTLPGSGACVKPGATLNGFDVPSTVSK